MPRAFGIVSALALVSPVYGWAQAVDTAPEVGREGLVVKTVPVRDCRVVRGFLGKPVDGSVRSWDYRGVVREYPRTASDGVAYAFNGNDGVHIDLADAEGFDAVVLRGGARTRMYAGATSLLEPPSGQPESRAPTWAFPGGLDTQVAQLTARVRAESVSFFGAAEGEIADVAFYRLTAGTAETPAEWWTAGEPVRLSPPASPFSPESVYLAMRERYAGRTGTAFALAAGRPPSRWLATAGEPVHFLAPAVREEQSVSAVALRLTVGAALSATVVVQDPLNPRLDVLWMPVRFPSAGTYRVTLDIPDQVLLAGAHMWLTLVPATGGEVAAEFGFASTSRAAALPEALARRKMLMRTFFSLLSEPRPWGAYGRQSRQEFYASSQYARQCPELFLTIEQCTALDPTDDLVRQYREWVFLRNLDALAPVAAPGGPPTGVPAWAWYARQAWMEARRIAEWWLDERLVPTGEFGGLVGDDTDLYQQFADLPYFEDDGVGARLRDAAARLGELAQRQNLTGGLNRNATDSLHAYEEGINHLALLARWFYGDPLYLERCMESARNMEALTIVTPDGRRHFRTYERMGAADMQQPRAPAVDGYANPLMWHTALQVADYNNDPKALLLLREWADTWLGFMRPGEWATAVEVLSGKVVAAEQNRPLYGGYRSQGSVFLWLYAITRDARYAEPLLHYYRQGQAPYPANDYLSDAFVLGALDRLPAETVADLARHNAALALYAAADSGPLVRATIGGPRPGGAEVATLSDAARWPDMYTTAHPFTDRVFPSLLTWASLSYLGGYTRRNKFNPTIGVSWEGFGTEYAASVLENRRDRLRVLAYSFADVPVAGRMRLWALAEGRYRLTVRSPGSDLAPPEGRPISVARGDAVPVTLAPGQVIEIALEQIAPAKAPTFRPDLALTRDDVVFDGAAVRALVHNLGSADARDVAIVIRDGRGRTLAEEVVPVVSAPIDLVPQVVEVVLPVDERPRRDWVLLLDPDDALSEVYEGNNRVPLSEE